jgi:hypothetical protein
MNTKKGIYSIMVSTVHVIRYKLYKIRMEVYLHVTLFKNEKIFRVSAWIHFGSLWSSETNVYIFMALL